MGLMTVVSVGAALGAFILFTLAYVSMAGLVLPQGSFDGVASTNLTVYGVLLAAGAVSAYVIEEKA